MAMADTPKISAKSAASLKLVVLSSLGSRTKAISRSTDGLNQFRVAGTIDLGTQAADVRLHDVGLGIEMKVPNTFQQHRPRHHMIGMAQQIFQQLKFAGLKINRSAATRHRS